MSSKEQIKKFMNKLVGTAKSLCNPLQLFILSGMVLTLFEMYENDYNFNYELMGVQGLVLLVTGGLIYKLCRDNDKNLAFLTLGLFLTFWFLQKSMVLDTLFNESGNGNGNGNMNRNVPASNNRSNTGANRLDNHQNLINNIDGELNVKGVRGNGYMTNKENAPMDVNTYTFDHNEHWGKVRQDMGLPGNSVPVASNDSANNMANSSAPANFNGNMKRKGLNGNIPVKGNATNSKAKNSSGVDAYNSVGAYTRAGHNGIVGNIGEYYQKRADWVNQIDLSMPDGPAKAPWAESDAPCIIQQHDNRSVLETPSSKLRNYGINTDTHQPRYRLKSENDNKVQTGFDPHMPAYEKAFD